jgi:DNA polymerase-3 subunit delta
MKLQTKQIEPFIKSPDPKAAAILVYGPEEGLMKERVKALGLTVVKDLNDPFNVSVINASKMIEDPALLSAEANAMSMMGGKRLVRIEDGRDAIAPMVKDYLSSPNASALVLIEAGELNTRSALRILFEKSDNAAALPCYVEDERGVANVIRDMLRENNYTAAPDAVAWLAASTAGNRQRVRAEVEKLITYAGKNRQITFDDVLACCGAAGEKSFDDLVYSTGGGNVGAALEAYKQLLAEGIPAVTIARVLQNHFRRLHLARARLEGGDQPEAIMKTLSPPVFFKQEAAFRSQMQRWQLPSLERIMSRLCALEAQCKQTAMPAETLCSQAILAIGNSR